MEKDLWNRLEQKIVDEGLYGDAAALVFAVDGVLIKRACGGAKPVYDTMYFMNPTDKDTRQHGLADRTALSICAIEPGW